jgi:hypothetical protein
MKRLIFALFFLPNMVFAQSFTPNANSVYIDQIGNSNNITVTQVDFNKNVVILNRGDQNTIDINQSGSGQQSAFVGTVPSGYSNGQYVWSTSNSNNNNMFSIAQSGSGNHTASINLDTTVASNNNIASITQTGNANANKSFDLYLSGSQIQVTVVQDNPNQANSGSMSIQCVSPPCTGYSYIRH